MFNTVSSDHLSQWHNGTPTIYSHVVYVDAQCLSLHCFLLRGSQDTDTNAKKYVAALYWAGNAAEGLTEAAQTWHTAMHNCS